jgi:hypothetical protein
MHGTGMFDKPGVFYTNDPKIIFNDDWLLDQSKIVSLKQHKLAVLDFSSEHYGVDGLDHVYNALEDANINFLLLVHDPHDHQKFNRMIFYSYWYHWSRKNFVIPTTDPIVRTYKWGCLNGNPRTHRIYNYLYSKDQAYYESSTFSFFNGDISRSDDISLSPDMIEQWQNIKHTLPSRNTIFRDNNATADCNIPEVIDSYIHLVTETTIISKVFVTEKTWKPIASKQIFLIFGNPNTISYLRDCGVDVFDDLIDHSYDSIADWQERLHAVHSQLKHLLTLNLDDIYINTTQRRAANSEKFSSGYFGGDYTQTLLKCINMLS